MLRRMLPPEPFAVSADWSRRAAGFSALLALIAVPISRSGVADGLGGIAVLAAALATACLALAFAGRAAVVIWRTGQRGAGRALAGVGLALVVLAYPAYVAIEAARRPAIPDASTDLVTPPVFSVAPGARAGRADAARADTASANREAQRQAHPALHPAMLDLSPEDSFRLVLKLLVARRWHVVEASLPKGKLGTGHIDAIARSPVMGLPADIALRLRTQDGQTRVDMRIASRVVPYDTDDEAARIESFVDDLESAE